MAIYAVVEDATGLIVNSIVLDGPGQWQPPQGHSIIDDINHTMAIGGTYISGVYTPPPAVPNPPPSPAQVSSRQFWTQMAVQGLISENEAVDALGGNIPNAVKQYINGLPANQKFVARMFFEAPTFERYKRAASDLQTCFSLTPSVIDQFFQNASLL
jgi:hypothetical protein